MESITQDLLLISPILSITIISLIVLFLESIIKRCANVSYWVTLIGIAISVGFYVYHFDLNGIVFFQMVNVGGYSSLFGILFLCSALFTVIYSREYLQRHNIHYGEFYILILFATIGMMLVASAADLIVVFLGIELMSISLYVLAGFVRHRQKSLEASLKYFLLGAFSTAFLLFGMALVYGSSGSTTIAQILEKFPVLSSSKLFWVGVGLLLVGLAFKAAAVPFHMWVPDVYEGSPTTISGFMATGAKAAAFAVIIMIFTQSFIIQRSLILIFALLATASMIIGNIIALSQTNLKRMLAYSSIAHAGYMLVGIAAGNEFGRVGVVFYLTNYLFMNMGAFGVLSLLEKEKEKNLTFEDYAGLGLKRPFIAAIMAIFMFSLSGIPPFGGFLSKYYVFAAAVQANMTWLAIVGVLTSVVGVYYYIRLVVYMFFQENQALVSCSPSKLSLVALVISAVAVFQLGIYPSSLLSIIYTIF